MMAEKKRRDKKYKPKKLNSKAPFDAIRLALPLSESVKRVLLGDVHGAILAMSRRVATPRSYEILAVMVELSIIVSAGMFNVKDYLPDLKKARNGLERCRERYAKTKEIGLDGEALQSLKVTALIFEDVLNNITGRDYQNAIDEMLKNEEKYNHKHASETESRSKV